MKDIVNEVVLHIAETIEEFYECYSPAEICSWCWNDFAEKAREIHFQDDDDGKDYLTPHKFSEPIGDELHGMMMEVLEKLEPHFDWILRKKSEGETGLIDRDTVILFTVKVIDP